MKDLNSMARNARTAFYTISASADGQRNRVLENMITSLEEDRQTIFNANREDLKNAEETGLAAPLLHRLKFDEGKLKQCIDGLKTLTGLEDPLGKTTLSTEITPGLDLYRVTCPIGVIGVIFESRPDALIQIASLGIKSGNAVLLKGGSEAICTNEALSKSIRKALSQSGLPEDTVQLLTSREEVSAMLKEDELIDLIIPRGSNAFVRYIMDNSRIPVLGHSDGLCHVYIDQDADPQMAVRVAVDSKAQNVSVCNAMETLLVHEKIAGSILPLIKKGMDANEIRLLGDRETRKWIDCAPATEEDWKTEYLDRILSVRIVHSLQEAIEHINHYGSHHTDAIVTDSRETASAFLSRVDSASVYWNVSTRFADGFVYGFGAEVGIATGKIHARGPMGLEGLTTYKYKLIGNGQTMADMKAGKAHYTHVPLNQNDPTGRKEG